MANIKFKLEEGIVGQVVKDVGRYIGKGLAASVLGAVTGSPAGGLAAFNSIKNMMYDKKTYKTEQEKEKKMNNIIKSFGEMLANVEHKDQNLNKTEISVLLDFINDYFEKQEMEYRKNLNRKYTTQEVSNDIIVQLRKKLTYGDVKIAKEWVRDGAKMNNTDFFRILSNVFMNMLPIWKDLELIKRKKSGQYYSPDAK